MSIEKFKNDFNNIYKILNENNDNMINMIYKKYLELIHDYNYGKISNISIEIKDSCLYFYYDNEYKFYVCKSLNDYDKDRITVIVSKELKSEVKKYCIDNNTNMKELILELLVNKIKK